MERIDRSRTFSQPPGVALREDADVQKEDNEQDGHAEKPGEVLSVNSRAISISHTIRASLDSVAPTRNILSTPPRLVYVLPIASGPRRVVKVH